uniref:Dirigent protein n=1 Tax=Leersia perrieri TaxID=77586 RepID=A0A0D9WUN1_9ORYZ
MGWAQGSYVRASLTDPVLVVTATLKITDGPYNGSTIAIIGQDFVYEDVRELAVVGGTGKLRRASSHVLWTTARKASPEHLVLQLDIHASINLKIRGF